MWLSRVIRQPFQTLFCLNYNLTEFVKAEAKKQGVKLQEVETVFNLVVGSHFSPFYSSRVRLLELKFNVLFNR